MIYFPTLIMGIIGGIATLKELTQHGATGEAKWLLLYTVAMFVLAMASSIADYKTIKNIVSSGSGDEE